MKLVFENKKGKVIMNEGSVDGFNILSAEGLDPVQKLYTTVEYIGKFGQQTINVHSKSRVITLSGDVLIKGRRELENAIKVFSDDVWLTVDKGVKKRKIYTKIKRFEIFNKNSKYLGFALQLEADNPYFTDVEKIKDNLYIRENLVTGQMDLPCVFTKRSIGKNVVNKGIVKAYPQIILYDTASNGKIEEKKRFTIVNERIPLSVSFDCETETGEIITIDFDRRTAISNIKGDITVDLAQENYLSDFCLEEGDNFITVINETGREITAVCEHYNNYGECI